MSVNQSGPRPRPARRPVVGFRSLMLALALTAFLAPSAHAVEPGEILQDPVLEARARSISAELRCLVCQNQSIDDSDAPLAHDLRVLVREQLTSGRSDRQVLDYVVERYGEFVLLRPRLALHTIALWAAPVLALLLGGWLVVAAHRRRAAEARRGTSVPLTDDERRRLAALVRTTDVDA